MSQYLFETGIKNLSGRINLVTDKNDSFRNYIDHPTRKDNLENNIAWLITKLISAIDLPNTRTVQHLKDFISTYNQQHNASITFESLTDKNWVRIIFDTIEFPAQISRYFYLKENDKPYQVSSDDLILLNFLYAFKQQSSSNVRLISKEVILGILSQNELQLLIDREVLKQNTIESFTILNNSYFNYLKNEIGAALWLELSKRNIDEHEKIKLYVNKIIRFGIYWPDKLAEYFDATELKKIKQQAYNILINEDDLINGGDEFNKIWIDHSRAIEANLNQGIPSEEIIGSTPFELYSTILNLTREYYWLYQENDSVRLKYGLVLNLLFQTTTLNPHEEIKDEIILSLLTDTTRPYLIYHSCLIIESKHPYLIPHLLSKEKTSSISFILLNKIKIRENAIGNDPSDRSYHLRKENELKTQFFKSQFDLLMDKISLDKSINEGTSQEVYNVLKIQSINFYFNTNYTNLSNHQEESKRFEYFVHSLSEKRFSGHFSGIIRPRVFPKLLPYLIDSLLADKSDFSDYYLGFDCSKFELIYQILNLSKTSFLTNELSDDETLKLNSKSITLVKRWSKMLIDYLTDTSRRISNPQNIEILNWGKFWAFINEQGLLNVTLKSIHLSLTLNNTESLEYSDLNLETKAKLKFFLKSLALGISEIHRYRTQFSNSFQGIDALLNELTTILEQLTIQHCITDLENQRLNVFADITASFNTNIYHVSTIKLVFGALNKSEDARLISFHKKLLEDNHDLLFLLTIINLTESQSVVNVITEKINEIDVDQFIDSVVNVDQWKNAIIEALHSSDHFELAIPIIPKIEAWLQKVSIPREEYSNFIFRTKLMLAFKQKNAQGIIQLERPKKEYVSLSPDYLEEQRKYYLALHWGYNDNNYVKAESIFQELISNNPSDTDSRYNIFHLGTLQNIQSGNSLELYRLKSEWEQFVQNAEELAVENELKLIQPNINYTLLFHYCHFKDYESVDRTLQSLDPILKYDGRIIEHVFQCYIDRQLPVNASSYLSEVESYYQRKNNQIVELVNTLRETINNSDLIVRLRTAFQEIYCRPYQDLPKLVPAKLNGKQNIQEFIFQEIIQASCILIEKIKSIDDIRLENKYNDLLLAIMKLRFAVWDWNISDQPRAGESESTGNDLGELDFLISSAGNSIALIEALILTYANKSYTQNHIKKCFNYLRHSRLHYVIVYFKGTARNFDSSWISYKTNVCEIEHEENRKLISKDFHDTSDETDKNGIHTGITRHENGVNMYHIYLQITSNETSTTNNTLPSNE